MAKATETLSKEIRARKKWYESDDGVKKRLAKEAASKAEGGQVPPQWRDGKGRPNPKSPGFTQKDLPGFEARAVHEFYQAVNKGEDPPARDMVAAAARNADPRSAAIRAKAEDAFERAKKKNAGGKKK